MLAHVPSYWNGGRLDTLPLHAYVRLRNESVLADAGARALFAGTESGSIRSYRLPVSTGDCQELRLCGAPIVRLVLGENDTLLFVAAGDGTLFILDVKDRPRCELDRSIEQMQCSYLLPLPETARCSFWM